jgi:hypothetical protein
MAVLTNSTTLFGPAAKIVSGGSPPLVVSLKLIPAKLCSTDTAGAVRSSKRSKYGRHRGGVRAAPRGLILCPWGRPTRKWENSFMTDLLTRS